MRPIYCDWPVPKLPQARRGQGKDDSAGDNCEDGLLEDKSEVKTVATSRFKNGSERIIPGATFHLILLMADCRREFQALPEEVKRNSFQFDRTSEQLDTQHMCGAASASAQTGRFPRQKRENAGSPKLRPIAPA